MVTDFRNVPRRPEKPSRAEHGVPRSQVGSHADLGGALLQSPDRAAVTMAALPLCRHHRGVTTGIRFLCGLENNLKGKDE